MNFALNSIERQSAVWLRLKGHLEERLTVERTRLEGNLDQEKTAKVRGQIALLKELIDMGKETPQVE